MCVFQRLVLENTDVGNMTYVGKIRQAQWMVGTFHPPRLRGSPSLRSRRLADLLLRTGHGSLLYCTPYLLPPSPSRRLDALLAGGDFVFIPCGRQAPGTITITIHGGARPQTLAHDGSFGRPRRQSAELCGSGRRRGRLANIIDTSQSIHNQHPATQCVVATGKAGRWRDSRERRSTWKGWRERTLIVSSWEIAGRLGKQEPRRLAICAYTCM
ncbi:hypothetical protein BZA05DRAFT_391747 [Tricharina praecox]|uniref:uncharacterized protein n=1 Tax=Tricharina praecox TaxID=43433 RepID=UPI00221F037D|nr:uncharacterized protein BZA05DRAFT_391747 [Tricharina praecox]KAI5855501.1 hypothetical protein BZA05DRAFT_391747 [Tricharina praecox]